MMKKELILEGLGCASCAGKIESEIITVEGVLSASVNFVTQKLLLETEPASDFPSIYHEIEDIIRRIEPDVHIRVEGQIESDPDLSAEGAGDSRHHKGTSGIQLEMTKLVLGGTIFLLAVMARLPDSYQLIFFVISYLIVGGSVVVRAAKGIIHGRVFDENFLMSLATLGAFLIGEYPEAVAVMLFYLVGEMFQNRAVDHSRKSISALMDIRPDYANLLVDEGEGAGGKNEVKIVSPEEVHVGDRILVKPGEKIPLDGTVLNGASMVDTSALTGESLPRELEPGSEALSGFINQNGVLAIEVTRDFDHSTVSKILELVQHASSRKAPTEQFITKFARYYTPAVVYTALAIALVPPLFIQGAVYSQWIYRALVFLVISCPCALVISIPLGFFGGIGGASKRGILVKGSNYLEALNDVETVVFDKTGTLTKGVFEVTDMKPQPEFTSNELLELAAYAESYSSHPIALSIRKAYGKDVDVSRIENYEETAGQGILVQVDGKDVLAGNARLLREHEIPCSEIETLGTAVHVATDNRYAGYLVISDEVKEDAAATVSELKKMGVKRTVMLTGDTRLVGETIGRQLGIDEVYAGLLPADKVEKFEEIEGRKSIHKKVVYVGDGINDAPVLARADIGMAMGGLGSDAAIEAADIVIMTDEPSKIATAMKVARRTRSIVYQNIVFALGVKAIFLVLGAFGIASMWEAVFADVGVALIAIFNAMRVMNTKAL